MTDHAQVELRQLGDSGLHVSALALGTMTFGGVGYQASMGKVQVPEATRMVDLCLERGVNFFDTADVYSAGMSEEILGAALGSRREDAIVATKVNGPMGEGPNNRGTSRRHIIKAAEASLKRLGTDYIDLYQVHSVDELTNFEEMMSALDDLVRQGKVRYIGCSDYSGWHFMKAQGIAERRNQEKFISMQPYYSLVGRDFEFELQPACLDQNVGAIIFSPLAAGFLTGKQRRGQEVPSESRRSVVGNTGPLDLDYGFDVIEAVDEIAQERGVSLAQVAINWVLRRPAVASVLVGARTIEQLEDNLNAADWTMTDEEVARLDKASARPLRYPYWHQHGANGVRLRYKLAASGLN